MTELLIRSIARRPASQLARPSSVLAFALALAYGGGLWLVLVHKAEGGTERNEPGLLLHVLRDSTLALPAICLAVWVATILARRVIERFGAERSRLLSAAVLAAAVGLAASVVAALGNPLHASLFTAHHGGHELPFVLHAGRDGAIALAVNLPIAVIVSALLLRTRPWAAPQVGRWLAQPSRTRAVAVRAAVIAVAVVPAVLLTQSGVQMATAQLSTGACPSGAPVKSYDVEAIDVDIPLNRFGDHDPDGKMFVLADQVDEVREQESRVGQQDVVSVGLGDDPIQPLVVRANIGDCVEFNFTNNAAGEYGMQVDGLAFDARSSGAAVGNNPSSSAAQGESRTYRYYVPDDPTMEGDHYIRPGPGNRSAVNHGLFGSLTVEPAGSTYHHPETGEPLESGWEAVIKPGEGEAFREYVKLYHEIGDEDTPVQGADGELPMVDPHTTSYRPGSRAINYRSEPFIHRLDQNDQQKSLAYNSYTFGDPATPMQRAYVGDPSKIRITHAGSEMNHVYHLHGGGIRWRMSPEEDHTYDYQDTRLQKHPETEDSPSNRVDSQSFGPGESFNLEIEGGAGGVQHAVGDLLEHCHIAEHYLSGMWAFWRVFDTRQPDLLPLKEIQPAHDQPIPPEAVSSDGLIGKTMPDGSKITKDNLDDWVEPQLPPQGVPNDGHDASVWNWSVDTSDPNAPKYLGEPENPGPWPNLRTPDELAALSPNLDGHPTALPGDEFAGDRRVLQFNPETGRPAYPLLRTNLGARSPHAPNGHSGAPYLGEDGDQQASGQVQADPQDESVDPWAGREDGICPSDVTETRQFDLSAIELPIRVTESGGTDPTGRIFALNEEKQEIRDGTRPTEPLTLRSNVGDCADLSMVSELNDDTDSGNFSKTNMHIHHVQFDPQGSDGASAGMVFDQSVRPYAEVDPQLTADVPAGETVLPLSDVTKFVHQGTDDEGVFIGVGLGEPEDQGGLEIRQVESVDTAASTVTVDEPLDEPHAASQHVGTEFVQSRWYPDVQLDNVFFHDHVDGIENWGKGLVGQFIVEPRGSTYHDPETGEEVKSGAIADIRTQNPLAEGLVESSFREFALMTIGDNPVTDSTINLKSEPWSERLAEDGDPSVLFSSYRHGDPFTPLPRAYAGDPFVIRTLNVTGNGTDSLHIDGHRSYLEPRYSNPEGTANAGRPIDAIHYGVSERFTMALEGGAGGLRKRPGDYLYANGKGSRFEHGAWGILRVLGNEVPDLQPLPGNAPRGGSNPPTGETGDRPPTAGPGNPCPGGSPQREFDVAAVDLPPVTAPADPGDPPEPVEGRAAAFVPLEDAEAVESGELPPEPLALHAAAGECVTVRLTNRRVTQRASFHVDKLDRTTGSSGINLGYNPEQTVAPGQSRVFRYHVDDPKLGTAMVTDFGDQSSFTNGLYGALIVAPAGAEFQDPETAAPRDIGTQVDVRVPGHPDYRDFTLAMATLEDRLGANTTPYTVDAVNGMVNYESAPRPEGPGAFSSQLNGDPATPILRAHAGDPVRVHAMVPPGNNMEHVFSLGGLSWAQDPYFGHANQVSAQQLSAWETLDAHVTAGAGTSGMAGDVFYGDNRRAFTEAGMWGLMRVLPFADCEVQRLSGKQCPGAAGPAPPTATPEAGTYNPDPSPALEVELQADDADAPEPTARIHYTTDGTEPTDDSPEYTNPIEVAETTTIKAIAVDEGGRVSEVASHEYEIDRSAPAPPRADPGPGFLYRGVEVTLSSEQGSDVFHTTDGSSPSDQSERYTGPVSIARATDLKAVAVDAAGNESDVMERTYDIGSRVRGFPSTGSIGIADARQEGVRVTFEVPIGAGHYQARLLRVRRGADELVGTRSGAPRVSPSFHAVRFARRPERKLMARGRYRVEVRIARTASTPLGPRAEQLLTVR